MYVQSVSRVQLFGEPMDCSPLSSSINGVSQAKVLEWVAISSSRGSSQPRDRTRVSCLSPTLQADSLPAEPSGSPKAAFIVHLVWEKEIYPYMKTRDWMKK